MLFTVIMINAISDCDYQDDLAQTNISDIKDLNPESTNTRNRDKKVKTNKKDDDPALPCCKIFSCCCVCLIRACRMLWITHKQQVLLYKWSHICLVKVRNRFEGAIIGYFLTGFRCFTKLKNHLIRTRNSTASSKLERFKGRPLVQRDSKNSSRRFKNRIRISSFFHSTKNRWNTRIPILC